VDVEVGAAGTATTPIESKYLPSAVTVVPDAEPLAMERETAIGLFAPLMLAAPAPPADSAGKRPNMLLEGLVGKKKTSVGQAP